MQFDLPQHEPSIIKVLGVGGGGSNAVNNMIQQGIIGVDFAVCNTDKQALEVSPVPVKIKLGPDLTEGMGAGSKPEVGRQACIESLDDIKSFLAENTKMLFITAGMGGGTGTGAAPVIAKTSKEMGILTVAIVTLPFTFEGRRRSTQGHSGLEELRKNVDTLIVISNDKLRSIHGNMGVKEAFLQADNILTTAAKGIAEIITVAGYVNVDFEDVNTVMRDSGVAIMGSSEVSGDDRALKAVDAALNSPLLEDDDIKGAKHILINITSGAKEVTMDEIFEITDYVQGEAGYGTDLIWGNCYDEELGDKISVTIIATGFEDNKLKGKDGEKKVVTLEVEQELAKEKEPVETIFETGHVFGEGPRTFEFNELGIPATKNPYSYNDPYLKEEEKKKLKAINKKRRLEEKEKKETLRTEITKVKLSNPENVIELEKQPAYLRRDVDLNDVTHSSDSSMSSWSVDKLGDPTIRPGGNSFLHDNVD